MPFSFIRLFSFLCLASISYPIRVWAAFSDVSGQSGIEYIHSLKTDPTANHAGAAAVDVDGDGWTDVLVARYGKRPLLYINQQNGSFTEEAIARGLGDAIDARAFS